MATLQDYNWLEVFKKQLECGTYNAKTANPKMEMLSGLVGIKIEELLCECPNALDLEDNGSVYGSGNIENNTSGSINKIYSDLKCGHLFTTEGEAYAALAMVAKLRLECCEADVEEEEAEVADAINNQTGVEYEFELDDDGETITFNNANPTVATVPLNATVPFPLGAELQLINLGAGDVEITPETVGVTITAPGGNLTMSAQPSSALLKKVATDQWVVVAAYPDLT